MPHPAHLCVADRCQFHLATYVGQYIVSTVGEYWPERAVREIHAQVHDPEWLAKHRQCLDFDGRYRAHFGFEEIGGGRTYETMVFKASGSPRACCPFIVTGAEHDFAGYNDAATAREGHMALCLKWSVQL